MKCAALFLHFCTLVWGLTVSERENSELKAAPSLHPVTNFVYHEVDPLANHIIISFQAEGANFTLNLQRRAVAVPETPIKVYGKNDILLLATNHSEHPIRTYATHPEATDSHTASVYLYSSSLIHAVLSTPEGWIVVDPVEGHPEISHHRRTSDDEMVMYHLVPQSTGAARRLLQSRELLQLEVWGNCWPGQTTHVKDLIVGIAVDEGYWRAVGASNDKLQANLQQIFNDANQVYSKQMNINLKLGPVEIRTSSGGPAWNRARSGSACSVSASDNLDVFRDWRGTPERMKDAAIWHLLTDCYPPPGTVGVAFIGALCSDHGAGLSSWMKTKTWLTVAHEIGHNFAATHSFEYGQGKTGGIMDYGDGFYKGVYQFHPLKKKAVCNHIGATMRGYTETGVCWKSASVQSEYGWIQGAPGLCSVPCGHGVQVAEVLCVSLVDQRPAQSGLCDPLLKPLGNASPCNLGPCLEKSCGNGILDAGEQCDPPAVRTRECCTPQCTFIDSFSCSNKRKLLDAVFYYEKTRKFYIFAGNQYGRASSLEGGFDADYPKPIYGNWKSLSPGFSQGIDAATVGNDDSVFFFRGSQYVKYQMRTGQENGYPRAIVTLGSPFAELDAAVLTPQYLYFFSGARYSKRGPSGDWSLARSIKDFKIPFSVIDTAIYDPNCNCIKFYYQEEYASWDVSTETIMGLPQRTIERFPLIQARSWSPQCPIDGCKSCIDSVTCGTCDEGYQLERLGAMCSSKADRLLLTFEPEARVYERNFFMDVSNDVFYVKGGVVGAGYTLSPDRGLTIVDFNESSGVGFPEMDFELFLNLRSTDVTQMAASGFIVSQGEHKCALPWTVELQQRQNHSALYARLSVGDDVLQSTTPILAEKWTHLSWQIHSDLASVTVDGRQVAIPVDLCPFGGPFALTHWGLGKSKQNGTHGLDGIIDNFALTIPSFNLDTRVPPSHQPERSAAGHLQMMNVACVLAGSLIFTTCL